MLKKIVIVDVDGTISKPGDRLKYLEQNPKDWDNFYAACFEDEPIQEICDLVKVLEKKYRVIFLTGRREFVRNSTRLWLSRYIFGDIFVPGTKTLLMRPDGDKRHDTIVKPELLKNAGIKLKDIAFVLEDRNSMVAKWRELGVKCLHVAEGDF